MTPEEKEHQNALYASSLTPASNNIAQTYHKQLECGPMPNVMAALPNIGGALWSMPQSLAGAQYWSAVQ